MDAKASVKPKRHKKRKPRTQVSSDSESENEKPTKQEEKNVSTPKEMNDAEVSAAFTKYYMQRATQEFAEDLDRVRAADDFKDDALPLLVKALQQGTSVFSIEEQRRIVTAGMRQK